MESKTIRNGLHSVTRVFIISAMIALMAVAAQAQTPVPTFTNVWVLTASNYVDLPANGGNNVRGLAINPVTTNVLYFSSTGGTNGVASHVATVSFASGSNYLANLNSTGISGGTVGTAGVRVSDDGFVYGCNVAVGTGSNFKIYKWPSDTDAVTAPVAVVNVSGPSFVWRIGDYMDLRGSGINTEIVVVGNGSGVQITTNLTFFRPTDASCTTFTNFSIFIPGSTAAINLCGGGVAFEGTTNAVWIRRSGSQETRRVAYDPTNLTATVSRTNNVDQSACQGLKYISANGVQMLVTVQANAGVGSPAQTARVFTIPTAIAGTFPSVLTAAMPTKFASTNGNTSGNVDSQKGYIAFGAPGHGISFYQLGFITNSPPSVTVSSSGSPVIAGYPATFTGNAAGSTPLSYQWYFNTNTLIVGATTNFYTLASVQTSNAGVYTVIVTNLYGKATNSSTISVLPNGSSSLMTNLWSLAPGSRSYVTTGDAQRGLAYDPVLHVLVLVSSTSTNGVHLLDTNGVDLGEMDVAGIAGGARLLNACGVSDDGIVYVGNLITSASDSFIIYRWASADTSATIGQAYGSVGAPGLGRIGDTMAVRGSGNDIEILCSFRTGTNVALFTTTDAGATFTFNQIAVTNLPADAQANGFAGLGLAFGPTNTFFAKSSGFQMRQVVYKNIVSNVGEGEVINTYAIPNSEAPIGVDNSNGFLAAVGVTENPQNAAIYDLFAPGGPSINSLLDREFFPVSNGNGNGTGAVAVDVAGGRIFALDSNNGIIALSYAGRPFIVANGASEQVVTWGTSASTLQSTTNLTVPFVDVSGATSPYTNTTGYVKFFRLRK